MHDQARKQAASGSVAPLKPRRDTGSPDDAGYTALETGALVVDRSTRHRWRLSGSGARAAVGGLVTNDVASLESARGCYTAALTAKGKIIADMRVFAFDDHLLLDAAPRAATGWAEMAAKYLNPRVVKVTDVTGALSDIGIIGPASAEVVARITGRREPDLDALAAYSTLAASIADIEVTIAAAADTGRKGFDIFVDAVRREDVVRIVTEAGATPAGDGVLEIARIEAGRPLWGPDMDEGTLAQEARLDELSAISYTKGCYIGQETVARIHFRGHVNRRIRGLMLDTAPGADLPPLRATLTSADGEVVGDVRSCIRSPRYGPIALAMIRNEVADGARVTARWDASGEGAGGQPAGTVEATVALLPFGTEPANPGTAPTPPGD